MDTKSEEVNKLVILGNGFDLAHGFKTQYSDFIVWYLNGVLESAFNNGTYKDELISVSLQEQKDTMINPLYESIQVNSIAEWNGVVDKYPQSVKYYSDFFSRLIKGFASVNWVDIEYFYYRYLKMLYANANLKPRIVLLNSQLNFLILKLTEYLSNESKRKKPNENIVIKMHSLFGKESESSMLFLNFNYTKTINNYVHFFKNKNWIVNNIHGILNDEKNPIIFGYGDETGDHYKDFENDNNSDLMQYIKSFWYFKTDNYQKLLAFMASKEEGFDVHIIGHSCGLSDRVLLKTIFEHKYCKKIHAYHYGNSLDEHKRDHFEKTIQISRHFDDKLLMRDRVEFFNSDLTLD